MKEAMTTTRRIYDDSAYTTTCVSQSLRSSGSSLSRNGGYRSESSGYFGGNPSGFGSNDALPQPIGKRKDKDQKEKKALTITPTSTELTTATPTSAASTTILGIGGKTLEQQIPQSEQADLGSSDAFGSCSELSSNCKKSEEIAREKSVISTRNPCLQRNRIYNSTVQEGRIGSQNCPLTDTTSNDNVEFRAVVSMHDGLVLHATTSLKKALGYSSDEWINRSFIDFVHPKDKSTLTHEITKNIVIPYGDNSMDFNRRRTTSLFCSLRKRDEEKLDAGNGSDESASKLSATVSYLPFYLTMNIKYFKQQTDVDKTPVSFLTISAEQVRSAYKAPEEMIISSIFSTRHDRNCIFVHVDYNVTQYFGYLPQDMIGHSIFEFYHPEDLAYIKEIYETVAKLEGSSFRSKPYRFAAQNGGFVILETEWSTFINPWNKNVELVVGQHRVLCGPTNPNVFQPPANFKIDHTNSYATTNERGDEESKIIQREIRTILEEKIQRASGIGAFDLTSKSTGLVTFLEKLLKNVDPQWSPSKVQLPVIVRSFSKHENVMVGEISPHHENCDSSKSSTETLPSYNQLNYNEKMDRFFKSEPLVTAIYGSDEDNAINRPNDNDTGKSSPNTTAPKSVTERISGENSSVKNFSNGSSNQMSYGSSYDTPNATPPESYKPSSLTESLLSRHNKNMEELMVQSFLEHSNKLRIPDSRLESTKEKSEERGETREKKRGSKRSSTDNLEGQVLKIPKLEEITEQPCTTTKATTATVTVTSVTGSLPSMIQTTANTNISPSLATMSLLSHEPQPPTTTLNNPHMIPTQNAANEDAPATFSVLTQILPFVYLTQLPIHDTSNSMNSPLGSCVPMATVPLVSPIYAPVLCLPTSTSILFKNTAVVAQERTGTSRYTQQMTTQFECPQFEKLCYPNRPASQATSVKGEPGSIMAMSESSKKILLPDEIFSSSVSIDGGRSSLVDVRTATMAEDETKRRFRRNSNSSSSSTSSKIDSSLEEDSSDSSFYGSFLGSTSNSSFHQTPNFNRHIAQNPKEIQRKSVKEQNTPVRKDSPWLENVKMTPDVIYRYQLRPKSLNVILKEDSEFLSNSHQPTAVNNQLQQLHSEIELFGFEKMLRLGEEEEEI